MHIIHSRTNCIFRPSPYEPGPLSEKQMLSDADKNEIQADRSPAQQPSEYGDEVTFGISDGYEAQLNQEKYIIITTFKDYSQTLSSYI